MLGQAIKNKEARHSYDNPEKTQTAVAAARDRPAGICGNHLRGGRDGGQHRLFLRMGDIGETGTVGPEHPQGAAGGHVERRDPARRGRAGHRAEPRTPLRPGGGAGAAANRGGGRQRASRRREAGGRGGGNGRAGGAQRPLSTLLCLLS